MQYIDIFLASSIDDMRDERLELGNYIRVLNDMYQGRGIYFRLHMCEDMPNSMSKNRSQDEYNDIIRKCDYFYIMCWRKAGGYTLEEFDVALKQFMESGKAPKITTFFKLNDDAENDNEVRDRLKNELQNADASFESMEPNKMQQLLEKISEIFNGPKNANADVKKFMDRLDGELQHYYTIFTNIDSVKLKILLEMAQRPELQMQVACQDAKLTLNGQEIKDIHMSNLPFYANHDKIAELREQINKLSEVFADLKLKIAADPQNDELFSELYRVSGEKNNAEEELHKIEMDLMKLASRVVEMSTSGEYLTQRAKTAMQLFEQGKVKEALIILDDEERRRDAKRTAEKATEIKKEYQAYVKECQLKIDGLQSEGVTTESAKKIIALYEEIEEYVRDGGLDRACLINYVIFLANQNDLETAAQKGESLYYYFKIEHVDDEKFAQLCLTLAAIFADYPDIDKAKSYSSESLSAYIRLNQNIGSQYERWIALAYHVQALIFRKNKEFDQAENCYREAIQVCTRSIKIYYPLYSRILKDFAEMFHDNNGLDKEEALYIEDLEFLHKCAEIDPTEFTSELIVKYKNLRFWYEDLGRYEESEKYHKKEIEIAKKYKDTNIVCESTYDFEFNTAIIPSGVEFNAETIKKHGIEWYENEIKKRQKIAEVNPEYLSDVAKLSNKLAILYLNGNDFNKAAKTYSDELKIRFELLKIDPCTYEPHLLRTASELVGIYHSLLLNNPAVAQQMKLEFLKIAEMYKDENDICRKIYEVLTK